MSRGSRYVPATNCCDDTVLVELDFGLRRVTHREKRSRESASGSRAPDAREGRAYCGRGVTRVNKTRAVGVTKNRPKTICCGFHKKGEKKIRVLSEGVAATRVCVHRCHTALCFREMRMRSGKLFDRRFSRRATTADKGKVDAEEAKRIPTAPQAVRFGAPPSGASGAAAPRVGPDFFIAASARRAARRRRGDKADAFCPRSIINILTFSYIQRPRRAVEDPCRSFCAATFNLIYSFTAKRPTSRRPSAAFVGLLARLSVSSHR
ncbi:hypothetical protein EVAR_27976_1 [Eumeta japonica]|uniref:Uncharacterized protein n=1 Tax=Eumeta variegata TaxID=151549 RepID=A0A4C1WCG3_EUMVA|nr:hypothetical protein EVAR_27976_1 [Eumeta japonica]